MSSENVKSLSENLNKLIGDLKNVKLSNVEKYMSQDLLKDDSNILKLDLTNIDSSIIKEID